MFGKTDAQKLAEAVDRDLDAILRAVLPDGWPAALAEPALVGMCLHPVTGLKIRGDITSTPVAEMPTFCGKCGATLTRYQVEVRVREYAKMKGFNPDELLSD